MTNPSANRGLTNDEISRLKTLLGKDIPDWSKAGIELVLSDGGRIVEIGIWQILELLECYSKPKPTKGPGRPKKPSINFRRAEVIWNETHDPDFGFATGLTILAAIESLQAEAVSYDADHPFRLEIEKLFPSSSDRKTLEKSVATGIAALRKGAAGSDTLTWGQMFGIDGLRDLPRRRYSEKIPDDFSE